MTTSGPRAPGGNRKVSCTFPGKPISGLENRKTLPLNAYRLSRESDGKCHLSDTVFEPRLIRAEVAEHPLPEVDGLASRDRCQLARALPLSAVARCLSGIGRYCQGSRRREPASRALALPGPESHRQAMQ